MLLFRQFVNEDLGCASYLVGDAQAGVAVVVDPAFAIEQYLEAAEQEGVRIVRVLETHTHADHVSGHGRFALEHGLPVAIHPLAEPDYPFEPLEDGQVVEVGSVRIRVVHTPGHRPEHCSFVVDGELALTGDSMFVGAAARPDLAVAAREGAEDLYHSLGRLLDLGDDVRIYPGHVAGSLCGGNMSSDTSSTIAKERATNEALQFRDVQEFVLVSASVSTPRPPTTERVVALNRGPWVAWPGALQELQEEGDATVLDVRPFHDYSAGHIPGAISVPVDGGSFGTKSGFVLMTDERIVLHARTEAEALDAAHKLWAVGILEIAGYLIAPGRAEDAPDARRGRAAGTARIARPATGRRARDDRARQRLHPGLDERAVPAAAQDRLRRARPLEAGRHRLRERPARRDRRVAAAARGLRRERGRRRRHRRLRRHRRVPALRRVVRS